MGASPGGKPSRVNRSPGRRRASRRRRSRGGRRRSRSSRAGTCSVAPAEHRHGAKAGPCATSVNAKPRGAGSGGTATAAIAHTRRAASSDQSGKSGRPRFTVGRAAARRGPGERRARGCGPPWPRPCAPARAPGAGAPSGRPGRAARPRGSSGGPRPGLVRESSRAVVGRERGGLGVGLLLAKPLCLARGRRRRRAIAPTLQELAEAQVGLGRSAARRMASRNAAWAVFRWPPAGAGCPSMKCASAKSGRRAKADQKTATASSDRPVCQRTTPSA